VRCEERGMVWSKESKIKQQNNKKKNLNQIKKKTVPILLP
jgi:hypothetical protein